MKAYERTNKRTTKKAGCIVSDFLNYVSKHSTISLKSQEKYRENYKEVS